MNAIETAAAVGITGTDAEIVAGLKSTGVTVRKIDLAYLMELLNFRGMLRKTDGAGGSERWVGTLQNLKAALVSLGQADAVAAYETWFSHVTNPRQSNWDTTLPAYAAGFLAMRTMFAGAPSMPTEADFAAVAALGGGWRFETLTEQQLSEERQQAKADEEENERQQQRANWRQQFDAALNTLGTVEQSDGVAAVRAIADAMESYK
jgi:hypothetical protein